MSERWQVTVCDWATAEAAASALRDRVFVKEQGVPPELEMDGRDADCLHALVLAPDGRAIGTGRLLPGGRIGRLAVDRDHRGQGIGAALLRALVSAARDRGDTHIHLHAQTQAAGLYERAGFVAIGEVFLEAGIEHIEMELPPPI